MGGIRLLLAVSVLIVHSSPIFGITIIPGYLAVQVFYIISGFYMTFIYTTKYANTSRPAYYFLSNRFLRLYPTYILVIVLTILLGVVFGVLLGDYGKLQFYGDMYEHVPGSLTSLVIVFLSNITLIGQDIVSFFGINDHGNLYFLGLQTEMKLQEYFLIPIAWTVAVEIFFYLLTPFLVVRRITIILIAIAVVVLLRAILFWQFNVPGPFAIYRFAPTEIFWFLLGILSYKLHESGFLPGRKYGFYFMLVVVAFALLFKHAPYDFVMFAMIFLFTPAIFYRFSKSSIDRYLGELSYPVYLAHYLFLLIVSAYRFPKPFGSGPPVLCFTILFAVASYHFFSKPINKFRISRVSAS